MSDAPNPPTPSSQPAPASHPTNPLPPLPPGLALTSPLTVAGFQRLIFDQYYANDSKRGTPPTFMWFVEELGELSTALMNNAPGKSPTPEQRANLEEEFADVLAWLATLANINGVDLARALEKYTVKGVTGVKN